MNLKWYQRRNLTDSEVAEIAEMVVEEGKDLVYRDFGLFLTLFLRSGLEDQDINFHEWEAIQLAVWELWRSRR